MDNSRCFIFTPSFDWLYNKSTTACQDAVRLVVPYDLLNGSQQWSVGLRKWMWLGLTGSHGQMELQVRLFFRRVFLNHCPSKQEKAFWLSLILKPFPLVHQARILFLLYGPLSAGQSCTDGL